MAASWPRGTELALDFITATKWDDLPEAVRRQARRGLLDLTGALLAGRRTPVGDIMAALAVEQFPGGQATILLSGERVSALGAALANGFAQNALDIDDGYRLVKGHPGACVLPALLSALELAGGSSGRDFLTALVIGYEIGIRAGLIRHATSSTYHSSGSWGAIAAAAAAGRLLGLSRRETGAALGAAEYHAPIGPMMKGIDRPSMVKDSIGWGNLAGLGAVLLARRGFTGVEPIFSDCPEPAWLESLGREYEILNLYFKPYAACRWAQPAVAGALNLTRTYRLDAGDIARIRVRTFAAAARLSRRPPADTEEAQYNLAFPVAAALLDGQVGPAQVLPPRLFDPALTALAGRVEAVVADEFEARFPAQALAEVEIETHDGRRFSSGPMEAQWEPPAALPSDAELEDKFHLLVDPVLGQARAKDLARLIWNLDREPEALSLIQACVLA
ncbi:MAG: MmgE/PrpD family protein [Thermodesulfobacteriota bacterium]